MNDANLIPNSERTPKELEEITRKGGIASGKARRIKSRKRQLILDLLALRQPDEKIIADLQRYGVDTDDLTNEVALHLRQIDKAIRKGDTNAYREVLKAAGILQEEINIGGQEGGEPLRIVDTRKVHRSPLIIDETPEGEATETE
jgi:hypothetical protein